MMSSRLLTLFTALVASAPAVCYGFLTENMCTNVSDACANVPEMLPNLALRPNDSACGFRPGCLLISPFAQLRCCPSLGRIRSSNVGRLARG